MLSSSLRWLLVQVLYIFKVPTSPIVGNLGWLLYSFLVANCSGYVEFDRRVRLTAIRRMKYADKAHWEKRRGTPSEARDYCMKDDTRKPGTTPTELGVWKTVKQGKRSDILVATELLDSGKSMAEVAEALPCTYVRMHKGLEKYNSLKRPVRDAPPQVTLLHGPPGVGKTRFVREAEHPDNLWLAPVGNAFKWFDDYQNQEAVLFDDFDGKLSQVPLSTVLPTLDRYFSSNVYL